MAAIPQVRAIRGRTREALRKGISALTTVINFDVAHPDWPVQTVPGNLAPSFAAVITQLRALQVALMPKPPNGR